MLNFSGTSPAYIFISTSTVYIPLFKFYFSPQNLGLCMESLLNSYYLKCQNIAMLNSEYFLIKDLSCIFKLGRSYLSLKMVMHTCIRTIFFSFVLSSFPRKVVVMTTSSKVFVYELKKKEHLQPNQGPVLLFLLNH